MCVGMEDEVLPWQPDCYSIDVYPIFRQVFRSYFKDCSSGSCPYAVVVLGSRLCGIPFVRWKYGECSGKLVKPWKTPRKLAKKSE